MRLALTVLLLMASPAFSEVWISLTGEEINEALTDHHLDYGSAWQDFRASGETLYNSGRDSWGNWNVTGDQYCSQWPPNTIWTCYDVEISADGKRIRFVGQGNNITVGSYAK